MISIRIENTRAASRSWNRSRTMARPISAAAQPPVPPAVTLLDLSQTVPLAATVAVLPALAAALVVFRRPDPAAALRTAGAA